MIRAATAHDAAPTAPDRLAATTDRLAAAHDPHDLHDAHDASNASAPTSDFRTHLANQKWSRPTKAAAEAIATAPQLQPQPQLQPAAVELELGALTEAVSSVTAPTTEATATTPTAAPMTNPATMQTQQPALQASDQSDGASSMQVAVGQPPDSVKDAPPLTPLEQAVHDLISQQQHRDSDESIAAPAPRLAHQVTEMPVVAPQPTQALQPTGRAPVLAPTAIAEPRALPEQAAPSHLHLVLGDDADRVVVTVAVRGDNVNVSLRASDDQTAAALARNASSLDQAMRGRGLNLAELSSDRDPDARQRNEQPAREREQPDNSRPFILEEAS